jgi:hypothetical protein
MRLGLLTKPVWLAAAAAIPGSIGGAWVGAKIYRRLGDRGFQQVVLALLFLSGRHADLDKPVTMDFIAGRLRFAFYVRKGIANIPVSKEGTYSRRLGSYGLVGLMSRSTSSTQPCGWVCRSPARHRPSRKCTFLTFSRNRQRHSPFGDNPDLLCPPN